MGAFETKRLYKLREHPVQMQLVASPHRFILVPAGRRSGKTERGKRRIVKALLNAVQETRWPDPRFFAGAPTRDQAKAIFWADFKAMIHPAFVADIRETDLCIRTVWGAELFVIGMDKPQRIEGRPWDGGVLDEYANMKAGAWGENVRPALSDRRGWCWFTGVPEGRNHYYDLNEYALTSGDPEWSSYTWKSIDILDPAEVEAARRQLDPLVFTQEYEASFVNFVGRCYYPFETRTHAVSLRDRYNPRAPLAFCFDFNVEPGVAAVVQEMVLPNGVQGSGVIGEVYIPRNSNTPAVCAKLIQDWGKHQGMINLYGDATGGARGTAKISGSDWDLIKGAMHKHFGSNAVRFRVPKENPFERQRVNAVNSRLRTAEGVERMMVDGKYAPHVVKDFEGVRLLEGGSGEIDKDADRRLTHVSDAIGYYVVREFPISTGAAVTVEELPI